MSQGWNTVNIADKLFASWSSQTSMEMQTSKMERKDSEVLGSQLWKHLMGLELKHGVFKLTASSETNALPPLRYQPRLCPPGLRSSAVVHGCVSDHFLLCS